MGIDLNTIIQAVGSVGFPIFACYYLMETMNKSMEKITDALNNNTAVMLRVLDHLDPDVPLSYIKEGAEKID